MIYSIVFVASQLALANAMRSPKLQLKNGEHNPSTGGFVRIQTSDFGQELDPKRFARDNLKAPQTSSYWTRARQSPEQTVDQLRQQYGDQQTPQGVPTGLIDEFKKLYEMLSKPPFSMSYNQVMGELRRQQGEAVAETKHDKMRKLAKLQKHLIRFGTTPAQIDQMILRAEKEKSDDGKDGYFRASMLKHGLNVRKIKGNKNGNNAFKGSIDTAARKRQEWRDKHKQWKKDMEVFKKSKNPFTFATPPEEPMLEHDDLYANAVYNEQDMENFKRSFPNYYAEFEPDHLSRHTFEEARKYESEKNPTSKMLQAQDWAKKFSDRARGLDGAGNKLKGKNLQKLNDMLAKNNAIKQEREQNPDSDWYEQAKRKLRHASTVTSAASAFSAAGAQAGAPATQGPQQRTWKQYLGSFGYGSKAGAPQGPAPQGPAGP